MLLNRLKGDQILSTPEQLTEFESRATAIVLAMVHKTLKDDDSLLDSDELPVNEESISPGLSDKEQVCNTSD